MTFMWRHRHKNLMYFQLAWVKSSHYLNQCWVIVSRTLRNQLQWNFTKIQKNSFTNMHLKYRLWNGGHFVKGEMRKRWLPSRPSSHIPRQSSTVVRGTQLFTRRLFCLQSGIVVPCACPRGRQSPACRAITCHLFTLESPNFKQKRKTPWLRSILFRGWLTLTFKVTFNLQVTIYLVLSLSVRSLTTNWS